ncbi:hypothetical protein BH11ACT3_BH11ACT3_27010 [soil metagenome]
MNMTTNPSSTVDTDAFSVRRSVHIDASIEKVWAAITEPEHLTKWFPESATLDGTGVGATGHFTWGERAIPVRIDEFEPLRAISYRWGNDDSDPVTSPTLVDSHSVVMRFTLEPDATGVLLTIVESGFETSLDPAANLEGHRHGWNAMLDQLVTYLEADAESAS